MLLVAAYVDYSHNTPESHADTGRDPFNQNSNRSDREKRTTSKGGPVFLKLFRLDRTDPLSFGLNFPEGLVEWIAPTFPASRGCGLICANFDGWLVPNHLLSFVGGHRMVAGDYYSILIKRMMERLEGTGRDIISPFPSFPFPLSVCSKCILR